MQGKKQYLCVKSVKITYYHIRKKVHLPKKRKEKKKPFEVVENLV